MFAVFAACTPGREAPQPLPDLSKPAAWAMARSLLIEEDDCWRNRAEYCPSDPVQDTDPVLQAFIDRLFDGRMPQRRRDVHELVRETRPTYVKWMFGDGRPRVEAAVAHFYENAPDQRISNEVRRFVGVPPGRFEAGGRRWTSPHIDGQALQSEEAVRLLGELAARHPDASLWRLQVELPKQADGRPARIEYIWSAELDRVYVLDRDGGPVARVSPPLGGQGLAAFATTALHPAHWGECPLGPDSTPLCPP